MIKTPPAQRPYNRWTDREEGTKKEVMANTSTYMLDRSESLVRSSEGEQGEERGKDSIG